MLYVLGRAKTNKEIGSTKQEQGIKRRTARENMGSIYKRK